MSECSKSVHLETMTQIYYPCGILKVTDECRQLNANDLASRSQSLSIETTHNFDWNWSSCQSIIPVSKLKLNFGWCVQDLVHIDMSTSPASRVQVIVNTWLECIPIAAIHNNTSSVQVRVTVKYEQFLCTVPLFLPWKQRKQKRSPESFDINNYVIIMAHVM